MDPKLTLGDIVIHDGVPYYVNSIYAINWFTPNEPFVYGLVIIDKTPIEPFDHKELLVREGLLNKATDKDLLAWRVLYGRKG